MVKLTDIPGIGPVTAKLLSEHKIKTVAALASVSLAELQRISGFSGDLRARRVKQAAADCLQGKTANKTIIKQPIVSVRDARITAVEIAKQKPAAKKAVVIDSTISQVEADRGKKKGKKDGKNKKVKDKKKRKNKDKDKKKAKGKKS